MGTPPKLDAKRIHSLTDATFAVAMTALIFQINIPSGLNQEALFNYFENKFIHDFFIFFIAFVLLGILWIGNHYYQSLIINTNRFVSFLNILFLSVICVIPFSAKLLIEYQSEQFSFLFFSTNLILAKFLHFLLIVYSDKKGFFDTTTTITQRQNIKSRIFAPIIIQLLLIPLSFWLLELSFYLFLIPIILYLIPEHFKLNIFRKEITTEI